MSSIKENKECNTKKPEQEPDLSTQYRTIGIKAVAAAAHNRAEVSANASEEQQQKKKCAKEKANG